MGRATAAIGSAAFFIAAPCTVAGVVPWLITDWEVHDVWLAVRVVGVALIAAGAIALIYSFSRFVTEGIGTPAPVAPTDQLVVGGLYRYVRNPMYVAVAATIIGQALALGQPVLLVYVGAFMLVVYAFVRFYEEPVLARRYGERYEAYTRAVPAWRPRRRFF